MNINVWNSDKCIIWVLWLPKQNVIIISNFFLEFSGKIFFLIFWIKHFHTICLLIFIIICVNVFSLIYIFVMYIKNN